MSLSGMGRGEEKSSASTLARIFVQRVSFGLSDGLSAIPSGASRLSSALMSN
jgi:hypothetical protein